MQYLFNLNINKSSRILGCVLVLLTMCTSALFVANAIAQEKETELASFMETTVEASEQSETFSTPTTETNKEIMTTVSTDEVIDIDLFEHGLSIYKASYCGLCHESTFADTKGIFGPPHYNVAIISEARIQDVNYKKSNGTATTVEAYLRESILKPEDYVVPGYALARHRMPAYTNLTDEDVDALIYLLLNAK